VEAKRTQLSDAKLKAAQAHSRLYKRLLLRLKTIGLVDHVLDITFEETFKVLGKHLKKPCLALSYIKSVCNPLLQQLATNSEIRVHELIEKELSVTVCDHIKRHSVVMYGYHAFIKHRVAEWTDCDLVVRNRKCLNRVDSAVQSRLGWIAVHPPTQEKVRHTYNRRKALKRKDERKRVKSLQKLATKRDTLFQEQTDKYRQGDTFEDLLTVL
jgi:hypothetical protein